MALLSAAAPVDEKRAWTAAASYVSRNYAPVSVAKAVRRLPAPAGLAVSAVRPITAGGAVVGYIADLSPSGFAVLRADDDLPPLKVHSANGSYEALPAGFRAVVEAELTGENSELTAARRAKRATDGSRRLKWQALAEAENPDSEALWAAASAEAKSAGSALLTSTWDQGSPYNAYSPAVSGVAGGRAVTGCGPLALAQLLRYHRFPDRPAQDHSYTDSYGPCSGTHSLSDVGGLGPYDWDNMPDALSASSPFAQRQAVGRLIYHCGVAMDADYEATSTSVCSELVTARALREVFGYTCEDCQSMTAFTTQEWMAKIQQDIDANRPVYYTMVAALGGHALVCDGYRNGSEIHLNFGFSGLGDAWYDVESVSFYGYLWSWHEGVFGIAPRGASATNTLTVVNGEGSGTYLAGTAVQVTAAPPPDEAFFSRWSVSPAALELGASFVATQSVTTLLMPSNNVKLTAEYQMSNLKPALTGRSPAADLTSVSEGASVAFRVTASDDADPDEAARGMVSVSWSVDGEEKLRTVSGAPDAIAGAFTLKTDAGTVAGASVREIAVKVSALDRQGGVTETNWVVRVTNVPESQALSFPALEVKALGDDDFDPGAAATSGLAVQYASGNEAVATVVGGMIRVVGAGTATITARQPGSADFKAAAAVGRTLTVKARVTAEAPEGGGTVAGAGLYSPGAAVTLTAKPEAGFALLRWEDGSQAATRTFKMPSANVAAAAHFGPAASIPVPTLKSPGTVRLTVGVAVTQVLEVASESLASVTVSGLPMGLRYDAAAQAVLGVPTAPVADQTVTIKAWNAGGSSAATYRIAVEALPAWAQGTFNGYLAAGGSASMSVTSKGKLTGKVAFGGTNYSFSAASYASGDSGSGFEIAATAKAGKAALPLALKVLPAPESGAASLGVAAGTLDGAMPLAAYRNVWKDADAASLAQGVAGYYTAALAGGAEYGSGYLTLTLDKAGKVKAGGRLADGTAVSQSGTLLLDEGGRLLAVVYAAPSGYKGGSLFGLAELVSPDAGGVYLRPLDGAAFLWSSRNPAATEVYGAGFERPLPLSGGWYSKTDNLYGYYQGLDLAAWADAGAPAPELTVGSTRYASAWWNPAGVVLTPAASASGVLTGLTAPAAGEPTDADGDGAWDYAAENSVGLKISLVRPTGLFSGSFKAWFDYGATHVSRTITVQGVLTPVRENPEDGVEGRGFFLWKDEGTVPATRKAYAFNWSYDFLLLGE